MRNLILRHVNGIKSMFKNHGVKVKYILAVESNLGLEASHIAHMFKDDPDCIILRETGPDGKCGVLTTHQRKLEFVAILEEMFLQKSVFFCSRMVSDDIDTAKATLKKQLEGYRMLTNEMNNGTVFSMPKVTYSGKVGEDGKAAHGALQDDLCIALQLAAFWSTYVIQRRCKFLDYKSIFMYFLCLNLYAFVKQAIT